MKEAKPEGLLSGVVGRHDVLETLAEEGWKAQPKRVIAP